MSVKNITDIQYKQTYVTVTEFAKLVGVQAATLRHWCDTGKFKPEVILASGRRMYNISQAKDFKEQFSQKDVQGLDNSGVFAVYTMQDSDRLKDTYEVIVNYFKEAGKLEFITGDTPKVQIFSDMPYGKKKDEAWVGCAALGKYARTNKAIGILVALDPENEREAEMIGVINTLSSALDIPIVPIFDKVKRVQIERKRKAKERERQLELELNSQTQGQGQ